MTSSSPSGPASSDQPVQGSFKLRFVGAPEPRVTTSTSPWIDRTLSFASAEDEAPPKPSISGSLTVEEDALPDNPLIGQEAAPFSMKRICAYFDERSYNYHYDPQSGTLTSGFDNARFTIGIGAPETLIIEGDKVFTDATVADSERMMRLTDAVNACNATRFLPTVYLAEPDSSIESPTVSARLFFLINNGMSDGQIQALVDIALEASLDAFAWLENNS